MKATFASTFNGEASLTECAAMLGAFEDETQARMARINPMEKGKYGTENRKV